MKDAIVVTAASDSFFDWALSLIASLRDLRIFPRIPLAVVDVGLKPLQRQMLMRAGVKVVDPKLPPWWQGNPAESPGAASLLVRPHYCEMFRSAEVILHLDADVWIAGDEAVESAIAAARLKDVDIAAAVHDHPSYRADESTLRWRAETLGFYAGSTGKPSDIAAADYVNAGLFAAKTRSPLWAAWQQVFSRVAKRAGDHVINDQAALNVAIRDMGLRLHRLDPGCNWLSHLALPAFDAGTGRLVEPSAPFAPISALHVSGTEKSRVHSLNVLGGGVIETALDRKSFLAARDRWIRRSRR